MSLKLNRRAGLALTAVTVAGLLLAGCSNSAQDSTAKVDTASSAAATTSATATEAQKITFTDSYIKAMAPGADMTAVFGVLHNNTDKDINIVAFKADIDADVFELHEVVDGKMRMKEGGFIIPAGQDYVLEPGSDHLMIMNVHDPIEAGEDTDITITLADGTELSFENIPARTIASGDEEYVGGHGEHGSHGDSKDKH
ncbi:copper chaperone PCu(A)C [Corynebacterium felinum]|uniref:Copper(I)-binding protein n=1 Tax=Corynebacterium felinum TaxID=131318 RepID=A0ABU2BB32_9CORY|nr:copper chaperone PCu(A)C [Corynebacterium felinum]MDF5821375.1 copper chaperone PCu(A)C [Corynebacterium felinum]MDR7355825.1 copper(I)-binding protein [Corynebacterium felinum]WJY95170.1 hypothetical protein CFELI_07780 [Corynebacterium felinum]